MGSALSLAVAGVRASMRAPAVPAACALAIAGTLGAVALPAAGAVSDGAAVAVESGLLAIVCVTGACAASAGTTLPARRASGVDEWLASHAPTAAQRRLAAAIHGALLVAAVGVAATAVVVAALRVAGRSIEVAAVAPVDASALRRLAGPRRGVAGADLAIAVPAPTPRALEVDFVPRILDLDAASQSRVPVSLAFDAATPTATDVAMRGTLRVALPPGTTRVRLRDDDPRVDLVPVAARFVGEPASFLVQVALAGLLATLAALCVVPAAVFLSRGASGATAGIAAATLFLLGVWHVPLLGLARDAALVRGPAPGAVLSAAAAISPDLSGLRALSDLARGRAIGAGHFAALWPATVHALVATLALVPGRRTVR